MSLVPCPRGFVTSLRTGKPLRRERFLCRKWCMPAASGQQGDLWCCVRELLGFPACPRVPGQDVQTPAGDCSAMELG